MTSRQQLTQPALKTPVSTSKATPKVCTSAAFSQVVILSIVIGLMNLVLHDQPLLAQTEANQPLANQADTEAIKREILLLGDVDPTVRKNAKAAIENFGNAAISELTKAAKFETTKDYETQVMAAKILATLKNAIALKEAEKFARGETELEGWPAFKKFAGDTPEGRLLFRDIYLHNHYELLRATSPPTPGTDRYTASYSRLKSLFDSSDLAQVCFGMFLLALKQNEQETGEANGAAQTIDAGLSLRQMRILFATLALKKSPLAKLSGSDLAPIMLVRAIIESAPQSPRLLSGKISLIQQIKSQEISPLLFDFAAPEKPTVIRVQAIEHAIKIADKDTFKKFNTYLNDTTEVGKYLVPPDDDEPAKQGSKQQICQVQIRDLILLGNLQLNQQDPTEFGFRAEAISTNKLNMKQAGFVNNETREEAFKRFRSTTGNKVSPLR